MMIFLPVLYFFIGWLIGKTSWNFKATASRLLMTLFIPIVIIFNVSINFSYMGWAILFTVLCMLILMAISRYMSPDPITRLCFFYLNIGWLGLPVASALFGYEATVIVIAAYVGSSIIGNTIGSSMLAGKSLSLKKILKTPPVIALIIGLACIPFNHQVLLYGTKIYKISSYFMGFLGMAILGSWVAKIRLDISAFISEIRHFFIRSSVIFCLISLILILGIIFNLTFIKQNMATLYLFCLLPPAANIIVLETYYMGTGKSAPAISYGTCVSIISIAIYATAIYCFRLF